MTDEVILQRHDGGICELVINRPDSRNALDWDAWRCFDAILTELRNDGDVRVLVIRGGEDIFSAGGDLKAPGALGSGVFAPAARLEFAQRVISDLYRFPQPTIAAVEGGAVGVGWSLVLACDLVVAAKNAYFFAPFVRRGYAPDGGLAWFLTRAVGRHRALELLLLADHLTALDAYGFGLVTRLSQEGQARQEALSLAARLTTVSADAARLGRGSVRLALDLSLDDYLDDEVIRVALALGGPDAREGRAAFVQGRSPTFPGG
jgi:2-(1,2-epoxy-1,2-dihydrophenyl)acetyl-CoA isomerase